MILLEAQRYRCQNRECAAEIEVTIGSVEGEFHVTCCCGSEMKKPYSQPVLANRGADREVLAPLFGTTVGA